jgi:hypothetical protein
MGMVPPLVVEQRSGAYLIEQRTWIVVSLFVLVPVAVYTKFYEGPAAAWVNNSLGGGCSTRSSGVDSRSSSHRMPIRGNSIHCGVVGMHVRGDAAVALAERIALFYCPSRG